jgi:paraquat-inducible protein B
MFLVGAIIILFASLVLFGSGRFFRQTSELLLSFQEPVNGLEVGAPVKLMGVTIGQVKDIAVGLTAEDKAVLINVIIEIDRDRSQAAVKNRPVLLGDRQRFETAVREVGLRGQLDILSLLSGQLYVALEIFPDQPGFQLHQEATHGYWEIPTLPSTKRQLIQSAVTSLNNFAQFDFQGTSEELRGLMAEVRTAVAQAEVRKLSANLNRTLDQLVELLATPELKVAITNLNSAMVKLDRLGDTLNTRVDPLLATAEADLKKAGVMFDTAIQTLERLQAQVEPESNLSRELIRTLDEASTTLSVLRQLAEEIRRNPNSIITGREKSQP